MKLSIVPDEIDLKRVERDLNEHLPEALKVATIEAAQEFVGIWRNTAEALDIYDTGAYLRSIGIYTDPADVQAAVGIVDARSLIEAEASVLYAGVIEGGRHDRPSYEPKFPASKALDRFERENVYEEKLNEELRRFIQD